jgi:hypothetical protein
LQWANAYLLALVRHTIESTRGHSVGEEAAPEILESFFESDYQKDLLR